MSENEDSTNEENNELIDNPEKTDDQTKKLEEENSDLKDKWQRALADYQNLERRTQVEISQRVSSKTNDLLQILLTSMKILFVLKILCLKKKLILLE